MADLDFDYDMMGTEQSINLHRRRIKRKKQILIGVIVVLSIALIIMIAVIAKHSSSKHKEQRENQNATAKTTTVSHTIPTPTHQANPSPPGPTHAPPKTPTTTTLQPPVGTTTPPTVPTTTNHPEPFNLSFVVPKRTPPYQRAEIFIGIQTRHITVTYFRENLKKAVQKLVDSLDFDRGLVRLHIATSEAYFESHYYDNGADAKRFIKDMFLFPEYNLTKNEISAEAMIASAITLLKNDLPNLLRPRYLILFTDNTDSINYHRFAFIENALNAEDVQLNITLVTIDSDRHPININEKITFAHFSNPVSPGNYTNFLESFQEKIKKATNCTTEDKALCDFNGIFVSAKGLANVLATNNESSSCKVNTGNSTELPGTCVAKCWDTASCKVSNAENVICNALVAQNVSTVIEDVNARKSFEQLYHNRKMWKFCFDKAN